MTNYFPYSALVNIYQTVKQTISRPAYTADWAVAEPAVSVAANPIAISEIYY